MLKKKRHPYQKERKKKFSFIDPTSVARYTPHQSRHLTIFLPANFEKSGPNNFPRRSPTLKLSPLSLSPLNYLFSLSLLYTTYRAIRAKKKSQLKARRRRRARKSRIRYTRRSFALRDRALFSRCVLSLLCAPAAIFAFFPFFSTSATRYPHSPLLNAFAGVFFAVAAASVRSKVLWEAFCYWPSGSLAGCGFWLYRECFFFFVILLPSSFVFQYDN